MVRSWCDGSLDRSFIELFLVPASAPQLLIVKAVVCAILSCILVIYHGPMPYNRKYNVLSVSLNKTSPSSFSNYSVIIVKGITVVESVSDMAMRKTTCLELDTESVTCCVPLIHTAHVESNDTVHVCVCVVCFPL